VDAVKLTVWDPAASMIAEVTPPGALQPERAFGAKAHATGFASPPELPVWHLGGALHWREIYVAALSVVETFSI